MAAADKKKIHIRFSIRDFVVKELNIEYLIRNSSYNASGQEFVLNQSLNQECGFIATCNYRTDKTRVGSEPSMTATFRRVVGELPLADMPEAIVVDIFRRVILHYD